MRGFKLLLCAFVLAIACFVFPSFGHAAAPALWLTGACGRESADAINAYRKGGAWYFFLPYGADPANMRLYFSGADTVTYNDKRLESGGSAAFLEGKDSIYLKCGGSLWKLRVMYGSGIPALFISTASGSLDAVHSDKEYKEAGSLLFADAAGGIRYNGALEHIKIRGNSSIAFKKKNYQIKLTDSTDLLAFGKAKRWILTSCARDKSLLRNKITMDMAAYAGLACTPQSAFADLYINGDYMGCYLFSEKVEIGPGRVDIEDLEKATEKLNGGDVSLFPRTGSAKALEGAYKAYLIPNEPTDITGGYLVEMEAYAVRYEQNASAYHTLRGKTMVVKSPEFTSVRQMAYISNFMQGFENAIMAEDGIDPGTGKHYSAFVDRESLVSKYLLEEICKNYDGNRSSQFFYKPPDSVSAVAFAGPAWDYDSAYGSYAQEHNKKVLSPSGFWINAAGGSYWWPALYRHADFASAVKERYEAVFAPAMRILLGRQAAAGGLKSLKDYAAGISASSEMNFIRWPMTDSANGVADTGDTLDANLAFLYDFISRRMAFLDDAFSR
jgi:hypothetical protein